MKVFQLFLCLAAFGGASGCRHVNTSVPGVLDLRSEGQGATVDAASLPMAERTGVDAVIWGKGAVSMGGAVSVEDRRYWVMGLVPVLNTSAREELGVALGTGGLREVKIGDQISPTGAGTFLVGSALASATVILSPLTLILPAGDVTLAGTRIRLSSSAADAAPSEP